MNGIAKILDFLSKPINFTILIAFFLTSLILTLMNFLPKVMLDRLHITWFLINYSFVIFIILIASFFFLIVQIGTIVIKKREDKKFGEYLRENKDKLFEDEEALKILKVLYDRHPQACELPYLNQKVKLLKQFGLITPAINSWHVDPFNPRIPYILQPEAEERIKEELKKGAEL
ncbi:super-infection exclusion protein B [Staphylococcus epidermidis]|uniref:super-infection exclusion protein B n=1 Tax=Staphylococcus epidermidis TaxID=1282 RepID=UPI002480B10D|nr:super-infection exclusion protein B [Staphylococcus epidermidis]MCG1083381.1 superinfection exclusion B family protein [Staphylococcus epidermidis]MCG1189710.1 superinfection exclusion B family protein [Staphylococcus epidermidis]MDH8855171.1 super-infection exclusion protein B [Staphylococcus epidermidis]MDT0743489.1 super-infection exclusion protein B [Staphylococcus epidermidis]